VQTSEDSNRTEETSAPAEAGPTAAPRSGFRISWWWAFPALLVIWLSYGAIRRSGASRGELAENLLRQSLVDAQSRNFAACLDAARRSIEANPSVAEAHNNAGWCAANLGKWDEGIASTREALRLNPNFDVARNNLQWILAQKGGGSGQAIAPATPADSALLDSLSAAQARNWDACVAGARRALELNPKFAEAFNNLGYCQGGMGKLDEAIENLRTALRLRPDFTLASNNLSWVESEKAKARGNGARK
jgi:tetratricopeptide (TPR) repeat protein